MFSTTTQDAPRPTGQMDPDRRNASPYDQQQYAGHGQQQQGPTMSQPMGTNSSYPQQQQQGPTMSQPMGTSSAAYPQQHQHGPTMGTSSSAYPQQHQQPMKATHTTDPYPPQETTWWEEAHSPHPGRAEQGYGPGPSGGHGGGATGVAGGPNHGHDQHHQQQYGQYGDRARDNKQAHADHAVLWNKVAKIICAILLPPLGVFLETGCDKNFAINVLLTILGYLPGIIHALYVIFTA